VLVLTSVMINNTILVVNILSMKSVDFVLDDTRESKIKIRNHLKSIFGDDFIDVDRYKKIIYILNTSVEIQEIKQYKKELNIAYSLNKINIFNNKGALMYFGQDIIIDMIELYDRLNFEIRNDRIDNVLELQNVDRIS
jgi:hypothetical protein